ncbi:MAG: PrsW family intramembrane metalloprotease [Spirochaetota bacterium]
MLAANLFLALAPSLVLLWWAYRRDTHKKESARLLAYAFLLGLFAIVPSILVGLLADPFRRFFDGFAETLYRAFVVAALVEEGVKYVLLAGFVRRHPHFDEHTDGLVYGMAASLGFAFFENALYVGGSPIVLLVRGLTAVPLHAGCGALVGYFVGRAHFQPRRPAAAGLPIAIAVHGLYDLLIFSGGLVSFGAIAVVLGLVVAVPLLFRRAIELDVRHGRAGPHAKPSANP